MSKTPSQFRTDDLARSGIKPALHSKLGMTDHAASADDDPHYRIWYFDPDGKTRRTHFNRRYYPGHEPRYLGRSGSSPQVYFPPVRDWRDTLADPTQPLIITEGEKKAIKATLEGFPCIALGGVSSFASKGRGIELIHDLEDINWHERVTYILYDSDVDKKEVRNAMLRLALLLAERGADTRGGFLPELKGERTGVDDYLKRCTKGQFQEVLDNLTRYAPSADNRVKDFAADHIYLTKHTGVIYTLDPEDQIFAKKDLLDRYANRTMQVLNPATLRPSYQSIAKVYWESPFREDVWDYKLAPSEAPRSCFTRDEVTYFNTWRGFRVEPKRGDTKPWDQLMRGLIPDAAEREWAEDWIAHLLQHPEIKMRSVLCVYSEAQGVGKSAVGDVIGNDILGTYYWPANQDQLFGRFTGFIKGRLFVMGDDLVFKRNLVEVRAAAKTLFERDTNMVEEKYERAGKADILCNFYLTGNDLHAFPLDPTGSNRRFGLLRGPAKRPLPNTFYTRTFDRWRKQGGSAHVLYKYLHRKTNGFDPNADALSTTTKDEAVQLTQPEHIAWITQAHERTGWEVATPTSLFHRFQQEHPGSQVKRATFFHHLNMHYTTRFRKKLPGDNNMSLFVALVRPDHWRRASGPILRKQLDKQAHDLMGRGGV